MKKIALITSISLLLASCGEDKTSDSEDTEKAPQQEELMDSTSQNDSTLMAEDTLVAEEETQELVYFSEEFKTKLEKYFSEKDIESLQSWTLAGQQVQLDGDFIDWYLRGHDLRESFNTSLQAISGKTDPYEVVEDLGWEQPELQGLLLTCVAECTELEFTFNNAILDSISKLTDGSEDDLFMELCLMSEGDYGHLTSYGFKIWFMQMWDYGGSTLIGDMSAFNFLMKHDSYVLKYENSPLIELLSNPREDALSMATEYRSHMHTATKIQNELQMILDKVQLSEKEKEAIKTRYEELNDPEASDLETDCENENCAYG